MPKVGGKHFPYTKAGKAAAKKEAAERPTDKRKMMKNLKKAR